MSSTSFKDEPLDLDIEEGYGIPLSTIEEAGANIDDDEQYEEEAWDEGGRSDCGYSDSIHDALMSIGEVVHSFFGEPSSDLHIHMKSIGSCFQEASYTARELIQGKNEEEAKYLFLEEGDDMDVVEQMYDLASRA